MILKKSFKDGKDNFNSNNKSHPPNKLLGNNMTLKCFKSHEDGYIKKFSFKMTSLNKVCMNMENASFDWGISAKKSDNKFLRDLFGDRWQQI